MELGWLRLEKLGELVVDPLHKIDGIKDAFASPALRGMSIGPLIAGLSQVCVVRAGVMSFSRS
ncbi:hypothetical protein A6U92_16720 [Agrobacterium rubi]|nr:hypothetical protein A6U92_16720 [Agrobacterium rubi]